jgi:hypothetical protein
VRDLCTATLSRSPLPDGRKPKKTPQVLLFAFPCSHPDSRLSSFSHCSVGLPRPLNGSLESSLSRSLALSLSSLLSCAALPPSSFLSSSHTFRLFFSLTSSTSFFALPNPPNSPSLSIAPTANFSFSPPSCLLVPCWPHQPLGTLDRPPRPCLSRPLLQLPVPPSRCPPSRDSIIGFHPAFTCRKRPHCLSAVVSSVLPHTRSITSRSVTLFPRWDILALSGGSGFHRRCRVLYHLHRSLFVELEK